jgi:hypothetical protein
VGNGKRSKGEGEEKDEKERKKEREKTTRSAFHRQSKSALKCSLAAERKRKWYPRQAARKIKGR